MPSSSVAAGLFGLQFGLFSAVLGFTTGPSPLRPALLPFIALVPYLQQPHLEVVSYAPLRGALGAAAVFTVVLYIDTVLLHKFTSEARGPTSAAGGLAPLPKGEVRKKDGTNGLFLDCRRRFLFGLSTASQARFAATRWPVKGIPPFSRRDPGYVPEKAVFLRRTARNATVAWIVLIALDFIPKNGTDQAMFLPGRIPVLSRVGALEREEIYTRIGTVFGYWFVQYLIHIAVHGTLAVFAVALDLSKPEAWPPIFGSIADCYSTRRFWGRFWHQLIRRGCSGIAHFTTYTCLGLPKGGVVGRYLFTFMVFWVSGAFHMFSDVAQGIPWTETGAMRFFAMQTLAIMFEDALEAAHASLAGRPGKTPASLKIVGRVWVAIWLAWSSPVWVYPLVRKSNGDPIVPLPASLREQIFQAGKLALALSPRLTSGIQCRDWLVPIFTLASSLLALLLLAVGVMAVLQPTTMAKNSKLGLKGETFSQEKHEKTLELQGQPAVEAWVAMFGWRNVAIGLAIGILLYLRELRAASVIVSIMCSVAVGEMMVFSRHGPPGTVVQVVLPSLLLLWVGPAFLMYGQDCGSHQSGK